MRVRSNFTLRKERQQTFCAVSISSSFKVGKIQANNNPAFVLCLAPNSPIHDKEEENSFCTKVPTDHMKVLLGWVSQEKRPLKNHAWLDRSTTNGKVTYIANSSSQFEKRHLETKCWQKIYHSWDDAWYHFKLDGCMHTMEATCFLISIDDLKDHFLECVEISKQRSYLQ